jgi:hypothetical protein
VVNVGEIEANGGVADSHLGGPGTGDVDCLEAKLLRAAVAVDSNCG